MTKKTLILALMIMLFGQSCNGHDQKSNASVMNDSSSVRQSSQIVLLKKVISKYSEKTVFFALYSLEKEDNKNLNSKINAFKWGELFRAKPDTVGYIFMSYEKKLLGFDKNTQKQKLKRLDEWISIYLMFNSLIGMEYKEPVYSEEIIFELPETKHLLKKYLESPAQDWGSLDVAQISELYFDFVNYMVGLDPKKRIEIVSKAVLYIQKKNNY